MGPSSKANSKERRRTSVLGVAPQGGAGQRGQGWSSGGGAPGVVRACCLWASEAGLEKQSDSISRCVSQRHFSHSNRVSYHFNSILTPSQVRADPCFKGSVPQDGPHI